MGRLICVLFCLFTLTNSAADAKIVKVDKPYSYECLQQDLKQIGKKYQDYIEIKTIGTSHFGREIWGVKLGEGKTNIVLIGAHHGREWLTSALLMNMLESYAEAYQRGKRIGFRSTDILNQVSIWFIPMLNPDGVTIQQNNLKSFSPDYQKQLLQMNEGSRNLKRWKANGIGVDLNRQYPAGWRRLNQEQSNPSYAFYKGKKPLESKEVIALTNFIREIKPSIAVAYHTAGREIFWNYKNGRHLKRDYKVAKKVSRLTNYKLAKPDPEAFGGGFTDWFITTYHRPAMTIEISYLVGETCPPLSVFNTEWKRNKYVGLLLAKEAKKMGQ
ncbi:g-D-glutamyl-meso-diaminopimelate peptidase [Neobacillus bataviensis]|uniref:G-D-glutamyl-meso-diaminopimelate peptidase n=1 Tax=Neobacillus bataviensis TaxID=220685 RepID=A0A561CFQ3_9BACI|nr:M14 family metallocarboxypeptidase [Neobacillus bataviensis]TWD89698.1 g-D-glutamyl-meso-diaminopimelate peptidase [Neobacillus bataviensis]